MRKGTTMGWEMSGKLVVNDDGTEAPGVAALHAVLNVCEDGAELVIHPIRNDGIEIDLFNVGSVFVSMRSGWFELQRVERSKSDVYVAYGVRPNHCLQGVFDYDAGRFEMKRSTEAFFARTPELTIVPHNIAEALTAALTRGDVEMDGQVVQFGTKCSVWKAAPNRLPVALTVANRQSDEEFYREVRDAAVRELNPISVREI